MSFKVTDLPAAEVSLQLTAVPSTWLPGLGGTEFSKLLCLMAIVEMLTCLVPVVTYAWW